MQSPDIPSYPYPFIAKEGWPFITISVFAFIGLFLAGYLGIGLIFFAISVFIFQFFRDPKRVAPIDLNAISSPADGRVVFVGKGVDPLQKIETLKISVFMNVFNVHSNRSPIEGTVESTEYTAGKFFNADLDKASEHNERNAILFADINGRKLTCVQIAGLIARRICCYVSEGDNVKRGARFGFIRFGSRVDIYLPTESKPLVSVGDRIFAHSTALALWP
jgi:phosphatidylserine decarboxylase